MVGEVYTPYILNSGLVEEGSSCCCLSWKKVFISTGGGWTSRVPFLEALNEVIGRNCEMRSIESSSVSDERMRSDDN